MKRKQFFDTVQADAYLSNSVIRLGEDPIFVHRVYDENKGPILHYWDLGSVGGHHNMKKIPLSDQDLNMNPVKLGMLATGKESKATIYCSRSPRRAWKIGLSSGSLNLDNVSNDLKRQVRFGKSNVLYSESFANTIKGKYLDFKSAMKLSKNEGIPVSFSRNFAVWGNELYYRYLGQPVGVNEKTFPILEEGFDWLVETLQRDLDGQN